MSGGGFDGTANWGRDCWSDIADLLWVWSQRGTDSQLRVPLFGR